MRDKSYGVRTEVSPPSPHPILPDQDPSSLDHRQRFEFDLNIHQIFLIPHHFIDVFVRTWRFIQVTPSADRMQDSFFCQCFPLLFQIEGTACFGTAHHSPVTVRAGFEGFWISFSGHHIVRSTLLTRTHPPFIFPCSCSTFPVYHHLFTKMHLTVCKVVWFIDKV